MTVPHSVVDMDAVGPAGPTTVAAINAAGTNGGATLGNVTLTASGAARGVYNTNPQLGRALALEMGGLALIDPPAGGFDGFDAQLDLGTLSTEIGIAVGDWVGTMSFDFYFQGALTTTFTTMTNFSAGSELKFLQMVGGGFDRVDVRASSTGGNWVIGELHLQTGGGYVSFGMGCAGANGVPTLSATSGVPTPGSTLTLQVSNMPMSGGGSPFFVGFGGSNTMFPGLGNLPVDLSPFGAPGCLLLTDILFAGSGLYSGTTGTFMLPIPNNPALSGLRFYNQAYVIDAAANQLGLTTSNGGLGIIQ